MTEPTMSQFANELDCFRARDKYWQEKLSAVTAELDKLKREREEMAKAEPFGYLHFDLKSVMPKFHWKASSHDGDMLAVYKHPPIPDGKVLVDADMLADSAYIAGAKFGWNCCAENNDKAFSDAINQRIADRVECKAMLSAAKEK